MGARCIFDWLGAFVGLVGLYACSVRRLEVRKRNAAHFLGLFQLLQLLIVVCLVVVAWVALLLLFVGFSWVVGCSFSLRMVATKRKGAPCWRVLSLFVGCVLWLSYCIRDYETIAGGFYPQGVTDYPGGRKLVTVVAYYLTSVAVLVFHYHSTLIERSCLACAGVFICSVNIIYIAALI